MNHYSTSFTNIFLVAICTISLMACEQNKTQHAVTAERNTPSATIPTRNNPTRQSARMINEVQEQIACKDSDNGDDYFVQGSVDLAEPIVLKEGTIVQILSKEKAMMRMGIETKEVIVGKEYAFSEPDQVYYLKPENSNGSLLIDIPVTVLVNNINFKNIGNSENAISIVRKTTQTDQCIESVLIENSCVRGINTGYLCPQGCSQGACIQ
ncbi:MAG: hypothetical protein PHZ00_00190 [Candidatus Peribacteraceae bacterium]|nr:hypothetical protein [Candidatus Peribacteraceae bacterium]